MKENFRLLMELATTHPYARKQMTKAIQDELKPEPLLPSKLIEQQRLHRQQTLMNKERVRYEIEKEKMAEGYTGFALQQVVGDEIKKRNSSQGKSK